MGLVIPGFRHNLISLGKLCDEGCTATLDKNDLVVKDNTGKQVLYGRREQAGARLWRVDIKPRQDPTPHHEEPTTAPATTIPIAATPVVTVNSPLASIPIAATPEITSTPAVQPHTYATIQARMLDLPGTPALIAYMHATAGYPVKSSWLTAIKRGAYSTWPGLTYDRVARHCPNSVETHMGHMAQPRQHIQSTKTRSPPPRPAIDVAPAEPTDMLDITVIPSNHLFTDDTGRFTPKARSGNQYIMIAYHGPSNAILARPFASKADAHRIAAYDTIYQRLRARNAAPAVHILDNEISAAFKARITANQCTIQLVPPHVHRRNAAERAIRTFKDHFLTILAGVAPTFPKDRWDLLIPQAELTLNLLRPSPQLGHPSAWTALFGHYNFDATPMGPAGCKVLIHSKPTLRRSWDFRCHEGYYIGPTLEHYRCFKVINKTSGSIVISDAIKFRHHYLPEPTPSLEDKLLHAVQAIHRAITQPTCSPAADQLAAITTLKNILHSYKQQTDVQPAHATQSLPGVHPLPGVQQPLSVTPAHTRALPARPSDWIQPRRRPPPRPATPDQPIATRTRSQLGLTTRSCSHNAFALLATDDDDENEDNSPMKHMAAPVLDTTTGHLLEHRQLRRHPTHKATWDASYANELGRLCQGIGTSDSNPQAKRVEGTDTFRVISYSDIPQDRRTDVTYTRVVCEVRPQKEEPNRTRITIGGNRICYPGDTGTKTGSLELFKLVVNSVLSKPNGRFACFDISNFYLGTPLDRPEYVKIQLSIIPQEFITEYDLPRYAHNGWIYFEINKGVYGLKQAGKLANDLLTKRLDTHGYYQCPTTPGLWRHRWRPILFALIVDDFGIQYEGQRHAHHLLEALQNDYKVTTDWSGSKFAGIDLKWDYQRRTCRLTMKSYITDLLCKYNHQPPAKPQHAPHAHRDIIYGAKEQLLPETDTSPPLDETGIKRIQGIVGSLLYYARAVDNKLLATLSTISTQQATATQNTAKAVHQLLDYVATYPSDGITYRASNMVLAAHSDASFLSEPKSRSRAGAHIFLSEDDPSPRLNGPVLTISQVIKYVMASAAEAELAAIYHTAREMVPLRNALDEMGWTQPPSPIQIDNSTAVGFVNDTIIQRRIKMIWMRLHWLRCREAQRQFRFYWDKGSKNMADYHTKHHPPAYHLAHRPTHAG